MGALVVERYLELGTLSYEEVRSIQLEAVNQRIAGKIPDTLIFCEHQSVITLGKRTTSKQSTLAEKISNAVNVPLVNSDRGGELTVHLPGMLMLYPVVSLRENKLGVSDFVCWGLEMICQVLSAYGLEASASIKQPGVWIESLKGKEKQKIASVGLRIRKGVSDYGFALNLNCDLQLFNQLKPCGLEGSAYTSLSESLGHRIEILEVVNLFKAQLGDNNFSTKVLNI